MLLSNLQSINLYRYRYIDIELEMVTGTEYRQVWLPSEYSFQRVVCDVILSISLIRNLQGHARLIIAVLRT